MLLMVVSSMLFTTMHVVIRMVPGGIHPYEIAFFRNLFGLVGLLAVQGRRGPEALKTKHFRLHLVRGVLNVISMLAFFRGVIITPLAQVAALTFLGPLLASVLAFIIFREGKVVRRMTAFFTGMAGGLLILRPGITEVGTGPLLILSSALAWSFALIVIKVLARSESSMTIGLYMMVVVTPISLVAALPYWQTPSWDQLAWLALTGLLGTTGHISLAQSFRMADATAVLPLDFLKLPWASLLGFWFFGEVPDVWVWAGGALVFGSACWLAFRERS